MSEELKDPIADLLIQLSNSIQDRCRIAISFTEKEKTIVKDWVVKIGECVESQKKLVESCIV